MNRTGRNLRCLLWKQGVNRREWVGKLAGWLRCDRGRAEEILEGAGAELGAKEAERLVRVVGDDAANLTAADLIEVNRVNVLAENMAFLIGGLPHGERKRFAQEFGVDAATVYRWHSGARRPAKNKLRKLARYFGLPPHTDLESEPIFLLIRPIGDGSMREWLHAAVDEVESSTLRELFPALMRLLGKGGPRAS